MRILAALAALLLSVPGPLAVPAAAQDGGPITRTHALAEFGEPLHGPDFKHFRYVNPQAPKGGAITLSEPGTFSPSNTFDNLNLIPLRGVQAFAVSLAMETLFAASGDELGVSYGLLAESAEYPEDRSWITFTLRPEARWHDGRPVTAEDVAWTFQQIQAHGRPFLKSFYRDVDGVEVLDERRVRFTMKTRGLMKPLVNIAGLTPYPKHWWTTGGRDIASGTLEPLLTSGPYRIAGVDAGRSLSFERVRDYWGANLPVNVGRYNFDRIQVVFFRDDDVRYEAFLAGNYDARQENRAQRWVRGYDTPAVHEGRIQKLALPDERPKGAQGYRLNVRRAKFADPRVREALAHLFDFQWIQQNLLYGQYTRTRSNFPNSDFGASGPPTREELALLEPFRDKLDPRVLTRAFDPPSGDGTGTGRAGLREALRLFREAGWVVRQGRLVNEKTGEPLAIEFLEDDPAINRIIQPYVETLRKAGIDASLRIVDTAQMQQRTDEFDFDATMVNFNFFPPPGPELRSYFGSEAARTNGSANYSGIADPVVDALIEKVVQAENLADLKVASRALDRVLLWGWYMVPHWYANETWLAFWDRFGRPEQRPRYASGFFDTWWLDPAKAPR
ncbi:MAG TPA: extracellular solute-binding protein [Azospirillaceae bacterium]|nr:extracellular solute-binding protein [Azospirillaceae bacterium]